MSNKRQILWVDDEVEFFRPHIVFLEQKGFDVTPVFTGEDAIAWMKDHPVDLVLLDESMPGMGGLETLQHLKSLRPDVPVIMVTKNEEESLMEEAIGKQIDSYLTKPVNSSQILAVVKTHLEGREIVRNVQARNYVKEFQSVSLALQSPLDSEEWIEVYRKMVEWEVELDQHAEQGLRQMVTDQKREANQAFCKFVEKEYRHWIEEPHRVLSPDVFRSYVEPQLESGDPVFFFVIDCMRYDQWLVMEQHLQQHFTMTRDFYFSIIPSATPYSRNAIFSGYYPSDLERLLPDLWISGDDDDYSMNKYEKELLEKQIERRRVRLRNEMKYIKVIDREFGRNLASNITTYAKNHLTAIVVNFVDMLAHSRSDLPILKEIAPDEAAYRSLTNSWFQYSSLLQMLRQIAQIPKAKVVLTTDHGSIRCMRGAKVLGDRETSTNLRYKYGRNVKIEGKQAMHIANPLEYRLPKRGVIVNYLIAKEDFYFVYPTEYNRYLAYYRDSFQHGGISLEELILPVITMEARG